MPISRGCSMWRGGGGIDSPPDIPGCFGFWVSTLLGIAGLLIALGNR